ncbi:hypothetical protein [Microvirga sp. KLBC 81]|uniref:hypothetical protein n=1 Tax=Microvirga sp. KLBC 81 TaxID=1862707 RepID=UPI00105791C4|nr:hypothetical protein [Microvirga sp. KLBC 81]
MNLLYGSPTVLLAKALPHAVRRADHSASTRILVKGDAILFPEHPATMFRSTPSRGERRNVTITGLEEIQFRSTPMKGD